MLPGSGVAGRPSAGHWTPHSSLALLLAWFGRQYLGLLHEDKLILHSPIQQSSCGRGWRPSQKILMRFPPPLPFPVHFLIGWDIWPIIIIFHIVCVKHSCSYVKSCLQFTFLISCHMLLSSQATLGLNLVFQIHVRQTELQEAGVLNLFHLMGSTMYMWNTFKTVLLGLSKPILFQTFIVFPSHWILKCSIQKEPELCSCTDLDSEFLCWSQPCCKQDWATVSPPEYI